MLTYIKYLFLFACFFYLNFPIEAHEDIEKVAPRTSPSLTPKNNFSKYEEWIQDKHNIFDLLSRNINELKDRDINAEYNANYASAYIEINNQPIAQSNTYIFKSSPDNAGKQSFKLKKNYVSDPLKSEEIEYFINNVKREENSIFQLYDGHSLSHSEGQVLHYFENELKIRDLLTKQSQDKINLKIIISSSYPACEECAKLLKQYCESLKKEVSNLSIVIYYGWMNTTGGSGFTYTNKKSNQDNNYSYNIGNIFPPKENVFFMQESFFQCEITNGSYPPLFNKLVDLEKVREIAQKYSWLNKEVPSAHPWNMTKEEKKKQEEESSTKKWQTINYKREVGEYYSGLPKLYEFLPQPKKRQESNVKSISKKSSVKGIQKKETARAKTQKTLFETGMFKK